MYSAMDHLSVQPKLQPTSSRILYDIPCKVCQDHSSGKHYGIFACDGCAGFFKRSIRRNRQYVCKAKSEGSCIVDKTHRNQCRACRLSKCIEAGMNKEAVQHERGPRNSTLRRQMALYMKDCEGGSGPSMCVPGMVVPPPGPALDLVVNPKPPPPLTDSQDSQPPPPIKLELPPPPFVYTPPPMHKMNSMAVLSALTNVEAVCESAARLLFMNVRWAKNVPAFTSLPMKDQLTLLKESWRELFLLGWAQLLPPLELTGLVAGAAAGGGDTAPGGSPIPGLSPTLPRSSSTQLVHEAATFQETVAKLRALQLDHHEFACLRAILLFKTALEGEGNCLVDVAGVAGLQDHTQVTLSKYILTAYPDQPFRFGKILLLLPALRAVSSHTIEELFFRRTIGQIPIQRIISDMYKSNRDI